MPPSHDEILIKSLAHASFFTRAAEMVVARGEHILSVCAQAFEHHLQTPKHAFPPPQVKKSCQVAENTG